MQHVRRPIAPTNRSRTTNGPMLMGVDNRSSAARQYRDLVCIVVLLQLSNRQDCLAAVEKVLAMHRELEAPSGIIRNLSIVELSPRLTQASLTMEVHRRTGGMLYDFEAVYTLAQARRMADRGHRAQSDSTAAGMHSPASSRPVIVSPGNKR